MNYYFLNYKLLIGVFKTMIYKEFKMILKYNSLIINY